MYGYSADMCCKPLFIRDKFQIPPFYPQFPDSPLPSPDPPVPVLTISRFPLFSTARFKFPPCSVLLVSRFPPFRYPNFQGCIHSTDSSN